ncbi:natural killer cell receptor 2B4-like [Danio aesculapii]|uniref:natural killer cell receptor 2B4-like n=1 Tax=Danio aesculapii TaxID=1142201 RepID=UPI0024C057CE|nr:natural killer cell receptor 2B4-like [Danio aesculapii]
MTFRLLLSFFLLTHNTGFSAEISVFVQTGDSVQLDIQTQQLPEFEHLFWIDEKSESIVKYNYDDKKFKFYDSYKERVYFNDTSFSLTLKNTQKIDSGLYTARISGKLNKDILTCKVSVIDEVEAPVLAVNSNWSSSELCSFTCSGRDINISSIHNSSSCPEEEVTSADYHTIRMNCNNTFIMCNYSNPVSWKTDIKKVHELCTVYPEKRTSEKPTAFLLWLITVIVLVTLGMLVTTGFSIYRRSKGYSVDAQMNIPTKVYENVDENKPQKSPEMLEKTEKPVTVYHTIGEKPDLAIRTNTTLNNPTVDQTPTSVKENNKSAGPVTIYCTIEKQPDQPKPETENTIYAVVKKPFPGFESPKLD